MNTLSKGKLLTREVIALRAMFTRSLPRQINVENAMGLAMSNKLRRVFQLADEARGEEAERDA